MGAHGHLLLVLLSQLLEDELVGYAEHAAGAHILLALPTLHTQQQSGLPSVSWAMLAHQGKLWLAAGCCAWQRCRHRGSGRSQGSATLPQPHQELGEDRLALYLAHPVRLVAPPAAPSIPLLRELEACRGAGRTPAQVQARPDKHWYLKHTSLDRLFTLDVCLTFESGQVSMGHMCLMTKRVKFCPELVSRLSLIDLSAKVHPGRAGAPLQNRPHFLRFMGQHKRHPGLHLCIVQSLAVHSGAGALSGSPARRMLREAVSDLRTVGF